MTAPEAAPGSRKQTMPARLHQPPAQAPGRWHEKGPIRPEKRGTQKASPIYFYLLSYLSFYLLFFYSESQRITTWKSEKVRHFCLKHFQPRCGSIRFFCLFRILGTSTCEGFFVRRVVGMKRVALEFSASASF